MVKQAVKKSVVEPQEEGKLATKKIRKMGVEKVSGQRAYKVKPMLGHEEYKIMRTKRFNAKRKETKHLINIDKYQVKNALEALLKFEQNHESNALLEQPGFIYMQIVTNKVPQHHSIRPVQVSLPHPIYTEQFNSKFAIIASDPPQQFTDKIQDMNIPLIAEVIGYEKLKKEFTGKKDKRSLIYNFDLFFCDWKIYNLLRKPTGSLFYERKKIPFPIDCENVPVDSEHGENYEAYLNSLGNFTYFISGNGPVYTIKIGRVSMDIKQLVKNVIHGAINTIPHVLGNLNPEVIRQISLKTSRSPSLPIFNQLTLSEIQAFKSS